MPVYQKKDKNGKVIKDTKGNSWYYRCYYTDMYGNRKQKKSKTYPSKSIAADEERYFLNEIKKSDIMDNNPTFSSVYKQWLESKKHKIKITTYYGLEKTANKYILEYFNNYKLHSIKVSSLAEWKNYLLSQNLSISRTNVIISYLKDVLCYSNIYFEFDKKIINSLDKVRDDKPRTEKNKSRSNYWTNQEYNDFMSIVDNDYYKLIFFFLYMTGVRLGEFRALTWKDVDLDNKMIKITKSLSKDSLGKGSIVVSPKTENSVRDVDLDNKLVDALQKYKNEQKKYYSFNEEWFVFGGYTYIGITTLRRKLNYYISLTKLKRITIHGFRHSHVSLLINLGCDSKDVAERIGDTINMVETTYYHMFPEKKKEIIERLNELYK